MPTTTFKAYDFGCTPFDVSQVPLAMFGAVICIAIVAGLAAIGRLLRRGRSLRAIDIVAGWSVVAGSLTVTAVLLPHSLLYTTWTALIVMIVAVFLTAKKCVWRLPLWHVVLFPVLPILVAINMAGIAKWDDFSHWVPNALYLYQHNALPDRTLPAPHSAWPGYPYAVPFLTYMASQVAGSFLVQAGAMFNCLFLCVFVGVLVDICPIQSKSQSSLAHRYGLLSLLLFVVTLGNPNFNASFTMTSQGDTPTMVMVGVLALLLWKLACSLSDGDQKTANEYTLQVAVGNALLVLIKQGNMALLALLTLAYLLVAWRNGVLKYALKRLPAMLAGAVVLRLLWTYYVDMEMAGNGFGLRPLSAWRVDLLGTLLESIGREMLRKIGCFALMLGVIIAGLISLLRPANRKSDFVLLAATVYAGYFVFLIVCYVGATFSEAEVRRAASFYRYSTQTGLLGIAVLWVERASILNWLRRIVTPPLPAPSAVVRDRLLLLGPLVLPVSLVLHSHWLIAYPIPETCEYRAQGQKIAEMLPDHARLGIIEPEADGMLFWVANWELAMSDAERNKTTSISWDVNKFNRDTFSTRSQNLVTHKDINAVFLQQAKEQPSRILGIDNTEGAVFMLYENAEWRRIAF